MDKKKKEKLGLQAENGEKQQKLDPKLERLKKEFLEVSQFQTKRENLLLGEYDSKGKYALTDDALMQDLVSMPKVLQERVDNVVYAYTKYKGYNLNFRINLDISESYCSAEMFLIEIERGLEEDIKHLTSLGNLVELYSPSFKENVYKVWNINLQETPLDKDDVVFKNMKEMEGELNFSKELIEILSQLYIVRLLKLLDKCGTLGLKVQGDYRALVEELIRKDPSLAQDHTRLKQILDQMIIKHNGFDTILRMPEGPEILKNFSEPIDRVRGKIAPVLVEDGALEEKKPEEKTVSKPAAKKKKKKSKGGDSIKPFVYDYKNYKPAVLATTEEIVKVLPSKENALPTEPTAQRGRTPVQNPIAPPPEIPAEEMQEGKTQDAEVVQQNLSRAGAAAQMVEDELNDEIENFEEDEEEKEEAAEFDAEDEEEKAADFDEKPTTKSRDLGGRTTEFR